VRAPVAAEVVEGDKGGQHAVTDAAESQGHAVGGQRGQADGERAGVRQE
jgi:hypothetical protein